MRALEIHAETMWRPSEVDRALRFMAEHQLNVLVFHDGDILNRLVFPRTYFQPYSPWGDAPPRRGENAIYNATAYIKNVARRCGNQGIDFMLEVKELAFPDEILELRPDLVIGGTVCPTHPFWAEFIETRYREMCEDYPDLGGFIVSVGSPEARATLVSRRCGCERCTNVVAADWHRSVVSAIDRAVRPHGKRLVIREFSYSAAAQQAVIDSLATMPEDIEYCIKPYARDYYIPWPDNTALKALPGRTKWLEYDVNGQYYGWGLFPCPVVEDMRRRFDAARAEGASGILLRTDWERVNGLWCLDTFNRVNLACAARLGIEPEAAPLEVLADALQSTGLTDQALTPARRTEVARTLLSLMPIVSGVLYVRDYVFNNSSMIPNGIDHAWWFMAEQNDLSEWDPSTAGRLDVTEPSNTAVLLKEKDQALALWESIEPDIREYVREGSLRLPDAGRVGDVVEWMSIYITAFAVSAKVVILCQAARQRETGLDSDEAGVLQAEVERLSRIAETLRARAGRGLYGHHIDLLTDVDRIDRILADADGVRTVANA